MSSKMIRISKYLAYAVASNAIYGFILYSLVTWLAGYSLLYAYLGNLALIALGLAIDELILKAFQSEKLVMQIKKDKDSEKNYRFSQWMLGNYVSFKAILYLFYAFLLIASQIIDFNHTIVGGDLGNFIRTTDYSIVIIVAFDEFGERFSQGRRKAETASEKFEKYWTDNQE